MPDQSSNLTALRGSHSGRVYVSVMTGEAVLVGEIDAAPDSESAINLSYTLTSGDEADVQPGMRVVITTAGGAYKGSMSVRFAGTISDVNLPVREFSLGGDAIVEVGDVITVIDDFVLTDKLVAATEGFEPDHAAYTDQNSDPAPVAVSGGWWAGWLGSGGTVDVPFVGSGSYTVDPDSGGTVTHLWTAPGGSFVVGSDTSASPTIRYSAAGKYLVSHTVTDADNGKSETQYIRVRVHDANDPPYECELSSLEGDPSAGFRAAFDLYESADLTAIPDGAPIIVWGQEWLNRTEQSFGNVVASRSHIICAGYLRRDRSSGDADLDEIEFEVVSPLAWLAELPGFSRAMERNQTPDSWQKVKTLTIKRAIIQLIRVYTNATQLFDLIFDGFNDAEYSALYLQKQNPYEQMKELADSRGGRVVCDQVGRIEAQGRLELAALADRGAITTTITLNADDVIEYDVSREHKRTLETFRARGFTAGVTESVNLPVFARFPASPGRGNNSPISERLIMDDFADLQGQCSRRAAWEDRVYITAANVQHHAPEVTLTLFGGYAHLFQFYREWLGLDGVTNLRGIDLSVFRFIVQRVGVDYADGTATTTITLRAETYAPDEASVDDTPPEDTAVTPEPPIVTRPPVITSTGTGTSDPTAIPLGTIPSQFFALSYGGKAARADSLDLTTGPDWEEISTGLTGDGMWACADPYNYFRRFALTSTGLYMCNDIWVASPAWVLIANNATLFGDAGRIGHKVIMSHNLQGWIMVLSGQTGASVSFDYGGSWTVTALSGGSPAWGTTSVLYYGDFGNAHISGFNDLSNGVIWGLYSNQFVKSIDWGLTWSAVVSTPWGTVGNFCVPYKRIGGADNVADSSQLLYYWNAVTNETHLYRSTSAGASWTGLGPGAYSNSDTFPFRGAQNGMNAYTLDGGILIAPRPRFITGFSKSIDAGASWAIAGNHGAAWIWNVNGFPTNDDFAIFFRPGRTTYGDTDGACLLTLDGTVTTIPSTPSFFTNGCTVYAEADLSEFLMARG